MYKTDAYRCQELEKVTTTCWVSISSF